MIMISELMKMKRQLRSLTRQINKIKNKLRNQSEN